ncbi:hypothetical protein GQ600_9470 [Phytophthora cactorum]|nr:hypothetical protein GQ600_9470 [Phytophthora cactorum]
MKRKGEPSVATKAGTTRNGKKAPIFWDSDVSTEEVFSSVVLDWMTNPSNYNGKTKKHC